MVRAKRGGLRYGEARSRNGGSWQENLHPYRSVSTHSAHYHPGLSTSAFSLLIFAFLLLFCHYYHHDHYNLPLLVKLKRIISKHPFPLFFVGLPLPGLIISCSLFHSLSHPNLSSPLIIRNLISGWQVGWLAQTAGWTRPREV